MSNDIRIVKYVTLIHDINEALSEEVRNMGNRLVADTVHQYEISRGSTNNSLALVFDYDKLNDYGKMIIEYSRLCTVNLNKSFDYYDSWEVKYSDIRDFKEYKYKIKAAKELVKYCRDEEYRIEAYKFIFFAIMVLTVDKTDAEEHLTLICDFARMLKITDAEMEDMLTVIRVLYHEDESGFEFKTNTVPKVFSDVLRLYNN